MSNNERYDGGTGKPDRKVAKERSLDECGIDFILLYGEL